MQKGVFLIAWKLLGFRFTGGTTYNYTTLDEYIQIGVGAQSVVMNPIYILGWAVML